MPTIVPAILEETLEGFNDKALRITKIPGVERIQVDFGDGIFIPEKLISVSDITPLNPAFVWEAHLMVHDPQDFFDYKVVGFNAVIVHYEAYKSVHAMKRALQSIHELGLLSIMCLKNETPIDILKDFKDIKNFQLMGVKPGAQGNTFYENTFSRVEELRNLIPNAIIEVDGGVNLATAKRLAEAGTDFLVAGSSIVRQGDFSENFEKLKAEINKR